MEKPVRQTIDGAKETFEDLLNRVISDFREENITWPKFIGFFSKRGRLEGYADIQISPSKKVQFIQKTQDDEQGQIE